MTATDTIQWHSFLCLDFADCSLLGKEGLKGDRSEVSSTVMQFVFLSRVIHHNTYSHAFPNVVQLGIVLKFNTFDYI